MRCPRCRTDNPGEAKFCMACGAPLAPPSSPWGTVSLADHSDQLQRLVPREVAARLLATRGKVGHERRVVTILFSDVKGSTAMADGLDPEDLLEIMDGAFDVLIEPIYRYEGTVARLMGDAILAFFGAPIAHEDDPERACRAALDIIRGAKAYAAHLEQQRGIIGFDVRVGINTGLVVVGEVGSDLRVEYTAIGNAINLASRMEQAAEPGTVLISDATHRMVTPLFETEPLGPIAVKGKAQPVAAYRVGALRVAPGKVRGIAGLASPLVGRDAELAELLAALDRLADGEGGIATVMGEAGLGKSRLVAEARKSLVGARRATQIQWIEGRCLSYGTSVPYLLWLGVLRGLLGVTEEDLPRTARQRLGEQVSALCANKADAVLPFLAALMALPAAEGSEADLASASGSELREKTFTALEMLLVCAAHERPLVIVCEDLHWADPTSITFLERLMGAAAREPLLLICTSRPEQGHPSWAIRESVVRSHSERHSDLWLEPLTETEELALLGNLLEDVRLPQSLPRTILRRTEGNPFFVEEVLRSLIDEGALVHDGASGTWRFEGDAAELALPDTLQGVLVARIDRLAEGPKRVLRLASVIGRVFLCRVLAAIDEEEQELEACLLALQREELIRERARIPELEFIFKHELTREAAYNGLLKRERREFHGQVAAALEVLFPERVEEQAGLLAHHWERAGETGRATDYLHRAGDRARGLYAHAEAIGFYGRALALCREQGQLEQAARTLMKLGLTHHNAFDFPAARAAYDDGFALWQRVGEARHTEQRLPPPQTLRVAWNDPVTLDPGMASDVVSLTVIQNLFSGLVALTQDLSVVPDVARRWEVLEDGCRYIFHLREDVRWSDGIPVTAGDFEFAWKRVLDPANRSELADLLYDFRGARARHQGRAADSAALGICALDDLTLEIVLERPTSYLLHLLTVSTAYPVPRHLVEAHGDAWTDPVRLVTNGPFRLGKWHRGREIELHRSPTYRGRPAGNADIVRLSIHGPEDRSAWLQAYESDRLDIVDFGLVSASRWDELRNRYGGEYLTGPALITQYLVFDVTRLPFSDRRVRRAFAMAIDREELAGVALRGYGSPATGGFVPPGMPGHSPGIGLRYDPESARRLLAEAGYPGGRGFPALEPMPVPGDELRAVVANLGQQIRASLGVEISWRSVSPTEAFRIDGRRVPQMYVSGWEADFPDPASFLWDGGWWSGSGWRHEEYGECVERARRTTNQEQRIRLYQAADRILIEECPIIPLDHLRRNVLVKPWVTRLQPIGLGGWRSWRDLIIEPHD